MKTACRHGPKPAPFRALMREDGKFEQWESGRGTLPVSELAVMSCGLKAEHRFQVAIHCC